MKRILSILAILISAPVISYLSGFITIWTDYSTEDTIGISRFQGFPLWFYKSASGLSIMAGWHPSRLIWNTVFWLVALTCLAFFVEKLLRKTKA